MISSLLFTRQLTTNALLKLTAELAGRAATFLLVLLAAQRLTTANFGRYNYALALGFVLVQLADFGLQLLITREVARLGFGARPQVLAAFQLKLWLCLPVMALLTIVALNHSSQASVIFLLGFTLLLQTFVEFVAYVFRGQQRLRVEVFLLLWVRVGTAVLGAVALWQSDELVWLAVAMLGVMLSALLFALLLLRRAGWINAFAQLWPNAWVRSTLVTKQLMQQAWPLGLSILLSIAYTRLGILLLELWGTAEAVAHYSAAWRLVEPTQIIPASFLAAVFPAYSLALTQNRRRAGLLGWQTSLLLAFAGGLLAIFIWQAAPWLISWLYGRDFAPSVPVLQLLGLSVLPVFINYTLTHYLVARGQQQTLTALTAVTLLLHGILCWLLIPRFGLLAPALSVLVAETVLLIGCLWRLRQPIMLETAV